MKRIKTQKGITLIALLVTIVVLIILASIGISSVKEDGIIGHANNQINQYEETVKDYNSIVGSIKDKLKNELTLENTVINENNIVPGPIPTPSECEHEWNSGEVTTVATCTTTGLKTYTCIKCLTTTTETIDALGHELKISETDATCTTAGTTKTYCTRTGCSYSNTTTGKALGHDMNSGTVTTEATCTTAGVKTYSCQRSGCKHTTTETITELGHEWDRNFYYEPFDSISHYEYKQKCTRDCCKDTPVYRNYTIVACSGSEYVYTGDGYNTHYISKKCEKCEQLAYDNQAICNFVGVLGTCDKACGNTCTHNFAYGVGKGCTNCGACDPRDFIAVGGSVNPDDNWSCTMRCRCCNITWHSNQNHPFYENNYSDECKEALRLFLKAHGVTMTEEIYDRYIETNYSVDNRYSYE